MGITNQMAPATAVKNIEHLLVITSDYGISNHNTFLVACAALDLYLTEHGIEWPVALLSDGDSSVFDFDTLRYLLSKQIW